VAARETAVRRLQTQAEVAQRMAQESLSEVDRQKRELMAKGEEIEQRVHAVTSREQKLQAAEQQFTSLIKQFSRSGLHK
jgi:hypothetical protein